MVNRKGLITDKAQVFYNDDTSKVFCAPFIANSLKWSESFLGDTMMLDSCCKYEEPLRQCMMDFDWPKISLFKVGGNDYSFSPPRNPHTFDEESMSIGDYNITSQFDDIMELFKKKKLICMRGLCIGESLSDKRLDIGRAFKCSTKGLKLAMDVNDTTNIIWSDVISKMWSANQNNKMRSLNGELISFNGLFGLCFDCFMNHEHMNFHFSRMEKILKGKCKVIKLKDEVLPHHSKEMPLCSFNTLNGKLAFPVPSDLSGNDFRHCPEMVIHDVV